MNTAGITIIKSSEFAIAIKGSITITPFSIDFEEDNNEKNVN